MANARAEGVADRVELCHGDARRLPFADVHRSERRFGMYPPVRVVTATKV